MRKGNLLETTKRKSMEKQEFVSKCALNKVQKYN